ncbi:AAA family ATPase [Spirosoma sp. BT702]|uniref:AAA family ATPase n=1 Tax=Spirosoma profusum TaxID=2771354 RepID=A0A927ARV0_9BACT|nr:AAA family ATPase [Spirosoma profusum]MBD2700275.1 AAA family ATPase [Spirosoma profusum]
MWTFTNDKQWAAMARRFPEIRDMAGVVQDPRHHAEGDVAIHTQLVLSALTNYTSYQSLPVDSQELVWTAALLHDVEKRSTTVVEPDGSVTSRGHARKGERTVRELLYTGYRLDTSPSFVEREQICKLVRYHGLPLWIFEKPDPLKTLLQASLEVNTEWLTMLARADVLGRICTDQADLLYRIDLFEEFCRDNQCWGQPYPFVSDEARYYYFTHETAYPDYVPFPEAGSEVVLLSGLPGVGKDTFIAQHLSDWPVISLDTYRRKLKISPTDKQGTSYVVHLAKEEAKTMLRSKTSFVWNATNLTRQLRQQLIDLFTTYKAQVRLVYLEVPHQQLVRQNETREHVVPGDVLDRMFQRLEIPALWEAHDVQYFVPERIESTISS